MRKKLNPVKLIGAWVLLILSINIIAVPYLITHQEGGDMQFFVFLMSSIHIVAYGILILSVLTSFIYREWFKKFWYINLFFFLIAASICFI